MSDEKHATTRVLDALQMKSFDGKRDYVAALEARADVQAVSLLVECLCDESSFLRDLAEKALVRMGAEHARSLRPLLTQGLWYTRASVARVLGGVGAREALPDLVALLADPNRAIAEAAREAVLRIAASGSPASAARALAVASDDERRLVAERAEATKPGLGAQLERLMTDRELLSAEDRDLAGLDAAAEVQDNVVWEVFASSKRRGRRRPPSSPESPAASPVATSDGAEPPVATAGEPSAASSDPPEST